MAIRVRQMTMEEVEAVERLARSRTEAARLVERAKIIWLSREGNWCSLTPRGIPSTLKS